MQFFNYVMRKGRLIKQSCIEPIVIMWKLKTVHADYNWPSKLVFPFQNKELWVTIIVNTENVL